MSTRSPSRKRRGLEIGTILLKSYSESMPSSSIEGWESWPFAFLPAFFIPKPFSTGGESSGNDSDFVLAPLDVNDDNQTI